MIGKGTTLEQDIRTKEETIIFYYHTCYHCIRSRSCICDNSTRDDALPILCAQIQTAHSTSSLFRVPIIVVRYYLYIPALWMLLSNEL